jgi:hypothetical protein
VQGEQWTVEIPLVAGLNPIEARATDAFGATSIARITVQVSQAAPAPLILRALPESGVAPLLVTWQVVNQTGRPLVRFELDPTGTGTFGPPTATLEGTQTTYATPGLFAPTLRAIDDQGTQYTATALISVLARDQVDALLKAKWNGMKAALMAGNIEGALLFFTPEQRARFRTLFTALSAQLPQIAQDMQDIQLVYLVESRAKYRLRRTHLYGGQFVTFSYYVYFLQDAAGLWSIEGF